MTWYMIVRHKMRDWDTWKREFDASEEMRSEWGLGAGQVCRNLDEPNEIAVTLECEDVERARQFSRSDDLRQAMQRAGASDAKFYFMEELAHVPTPAHAHRRR